MIAAEPSSVATYAADELVKHIGPTIDVEQMAWASHQNVAVVAVNRRPSHNQFSLREAAEATGPRTVIFDVAGTIRLESPIRIFNPYLTIAGQTAPGDGITVAAASFNVQTYDVIIRHMRFRYGDFRDRFGSPFSVRGANHVIVDHVVASWRINQNTSVTNSDYVTYQNCMIAKPLWSSIHPKGSRGFGALVRGKYGAKYSFLRNLYTNHRFRSPAAGFNYHTYPDQDSDGILVDFRNNVILGGWGSFGSGGSLEEVNFVNNYVLSDNWYMLMGGPYGKVHLSGNYRKGVKVEDQAGELLELRDEATLEGQVQDEAWDSAGANTLTAPEAWEHVIDQAGPWKRDAHDEHVIREVVNYHRREIEGAQAAYQLPNWWKSGNIDSQDDVGGLPELESVSMPEALDTNRNGIPDWWEQEHGLDTDDPDIANQDSNGNGYTNLEDYLNDLEAIERTHEQAAELR